MPSPGKTLYRSYKATLSFFQMQRPREVKDLLRVTQRVLVESEQELETSDSQLVCFLMLDKKTEAQRNSQPPLILCRYLHPHMQDTHATQR